MLAGLLVCCSGCSKAQDDTEAVSDSVRMENEIENRDYLNSLMKSWEIFNAAAQKHDADMDGETMINAVKEAITSEAPQHRVTITLACEPEMAAEYHRLAGEFKWLYANDDRYRIEVEILSQGVGCDNLNDPKNSADVFFYDDTMVDQAIANGAVARINDHMKAFSSDFNTADSISACTINGKQYGFPLSAAGGEVLIYDKRIFGSDISSLEQMIAKANASGKGILYALGDPYYSAGVFMAAGCKPLNDGNMQIIDYNTDAGLAAAGTINRLAQYQGKGLKCDGRNDEVAEGFASGTLCAAITDSDNLPAIRLAIGEENTGIASLPTVRINDKDTQLHSFAGFDLVGVNPYSEFPFTAQLFAYFISNPRSQVGLYYSTGKIPAMDLSEYTAITEDALCKAMQDQAPFAHIRHTTISAEFLSDLSLQNSLSQLVSSHGKCSKEQITTLLSAIPEKISLVKNQDS